ncbi:DUF397 domain-containing protein [Amycolatopsis sp. NPDC059021]|uniref:DUF397 domain-containing protein n=1 Tax=Amycolatopsis sp. NPDC059021 TaxID=3346704 RepID=UPI0036727808
MIQRGTWFKSSYSPDKADCVEVRLSEKVGIRDSKAPEAGQLAVPGETWKALLRVVAER